MRILFFFCFLSFFCCLPQPAAAQGWQWAKQIGANNFSTGQRDDQITGMEMDGAGNVVFCGGVRDNCKWDGQYLYTGRGNDSRGFVAKYDCAGNLLWRHFMGGNAGEVIKGIALDKEGNCYFSYTVRNPDFPQYYDDSLYILTGNNTSALGKLAPDGTLLWMKFTHTYWGIEELSPLAINHKDELIVLLGKSTGAANVGPFPGFPTPTPFGYYRYTFGLDLNGNFKWMNARDYLSNVHIGGPSEDYEGRLYVSGNYLSGAVVYGDTLNYGNTSGGLVLVFDSVGNYQRKFVFTGGATGAVGKCRADKNSDGLYLYGITQKSMAPQPPQYNGYTMNYYTTNLSNPCDFLFKLKPDGNIIWAMHTDSIIGVCFGGADMSLDVLGNVYSASRIASKFRLQGRSYTSPNPSSSLPYVLRISPDGIPDSSLITVTNSSLFSIFNMIRYIAFNEKGGFFCGGAVRTDLIFGTDTLVNQLSGNANDIFLARYGYACTDSNALIAPLAAGDLEAWGQSMGSIGVQWQDKSNIEWGYRLYRSPDGVGGWSPIATLPANSTQYTDTGLPANTPYWYKVAAYNNQGETFSNADSAKTLAGIGIGEGEAQFGGSLSLYPNPNRGQFRLQLRGADSFTGLCIVYDLMGREVHRQEVKGTGGSQTLAFDLRHLSPGAYSLLLKTDKGNWSQKWVRE